MELIELIYISTVTTPLNEQELESLRRQCAGANQLKSISGMLLYDTHHFMQVIEGEKLKVEQLFEHIKQDKRHTKVEALICNPIEKRNFKKWAMGLIDLDKSPSYRKVRESRPHRRLPLSYKLLKSFRNHEFEIEEHIKRSFGS
ncbi:BLUF domain-containing protein [Pseudoalteromonas luteoviolacea]|uniref:BLUF domain-containing protein n=1 Tax=Pseudoalteromonas luteoviolacea TaxID=43657 RepID=UPI001F48DD60|nr:BLUF domain-containing protein [Pseudoalteromonas luteoviolacea]MCF6439539.1 BLUF domain-containing protein [Pseudoalteromonas luteoviolacea]